MEEKPWDIYPSVNMRPMINDKKLVARGKFDAALYHDRYSVFTEFKTKKQLSSFIEIVKALGPGLIVSQKFDQLGGMLKGLATQYDMQLDHLCFLFKQLLERWVQKQFAFTAYCENREVYELYDLVENTLTQRRITTAECGLPSCHRRPGTDGGDATPLEKCIHCHSAAWCNKKCRRADWTYHKEWCSYLKDRGATQ